MSIELGGTKWTTWEDVEKELFTTEEIAESDRRVAEMMEHRSGTYAIMVHKFTEDDGSVTLSLDPIDLVANGENLQAAMANLVDDLMEYAEEYQRNVEAYHNAPNRREHLPLVERVLSAASKEELMTAIQFIE